jgi:serine-type D-Ala-D-Ala carboxypeptidase/endopeptidase
MLRSFAALKSWSLVTILAPGLVSTTAFAQVAGPALPTDSEIRNMLVSRIDVQHRGTGAIIAIVTPSGKREISYGRLAAGDSRSVNGDTVFAIQSVTKVFTALVLADMVRRREVGLDDPVAGYLPAGTRLPEHSGRQISLADLATHTSGLPLRPSNLVSKDPENKYDGYTPDLLYAFLSGYTLSQDPGSHYEYSNVGFGVLGQAISHRAGASYAQLVRQLITEPLGMRSTRLDRTPEMRRRGASGYNTDGQPIEDRERGALDAAGAMQSTANDLLKLLDVALGDRSSALAIDISITLQTRRPGGQMPSTETALAWNVLKVNDGEIVYKNGYGSGFRSFMGYNRTSRIGVVGLINVESDLGVDDIGLHLMGASFPVDMHVPRAHTEVKIDPAVLDSYVGRYHFSDTDILTITREGDHLYCQEPQQPKLELHPEGERDFFLKETDAQVTFESIGHQPAAVAIWHQWGQDQRGERMR